MFRVRNQTPGYYTFDLEKGSIRVRPNGSIDLEEFCSRKWITSNPKLREILNRGDLILVHDSSVQVPAQPIGEPRSTSKPVAPNALVLQEKKFIETSEIRKADSKPEPVELLDLNDKPNLEDLVDEDDPVEAALNKVSAVESDTD